MMNRIPLELYLHIPFCKSKCGYCDFLSAPGSTEDYEDYTRLLLQEVEKHKNDCQEYQVQTLFIGGGTPSVLSGDQISRIMEKIYHIFSISDSPEMTIECNPGTASGQKLAAWQAAGLNRISFGLQSADNQELKQLGRIHTYEEFLESYDLAREQGFQNINIDLMSALPGQTPKSWQDTLLKAVSLNPEHISAYSLIIEEGTPFAALYGEHPELLPDEEAERQMYYETRRLLQEYGYLRYEISNYAKDGYACRHNIGYWTGVPYLGFGLGAASYTNGYRYSNPGTGKEYREFVDNHSLFPPECVKLSQREMMEEHMFLGLRLMAGISEAGFQKRFGIAMKAVYGETIDKLIQKRLLQLKAGAVCLTDQGIDLSNYVMSEFLLE